MGAGAVWTDFINPCSSRFMSRVSALGANSAITLACISESSCKRAIRVLMSNPQRLMNARTCERSLFLPWEGGGLVHPRTSFIRFSALIVDEGWEGGARLGFAGNSSSCLPDAKPWFVTWGVLLLRTDFMKLWNSRFTSLVPGFGANSVMIRACTSGGRPKSSSPASTSRPQCERKASTSSTLVLSCQSDCGTSSLSGSETPSFPVEVPKPASSTKPGVCPRRPASRRTECRKP
mmetsp:Transcript_81311/g.161408  ORF Transcript_81311/g.161408 Transcript_81311/m.161408 type:complete len:234 (-) Transcript_81311:208-909(-)